MKFIISKLIIYFIFNLLDIFSHENMDVAANEQMSTLLSQSIQSSASLSRDTPRKKALFLPKYKEGKDKLVAK